MTQKVKMRALMSIKATPDRQAVDFGREFLATSQEARDLERMGQAERVAGSSSATEKPDADKADKGGK